MRTYSGYPSSTTSIKFSPPLLLVTSTRRSPQLAPKKLPGCHLLDVAELALLGQRPCLFTLCCRIFMTPCAAHVKSLLGLGRVLGHVIMALMTGLDLFTRLQGMVTARTLYKTQTGMHLVIESNNTELGIELDNGLVSRDDNFITQRTT